MSDTNCVRVGHGMQVDKKFMLGDFGQISPDASKAVRLLMLLVHENRISVFKGCPSDPTEKSRATEESGSFPGSVRWAPKSRGDLISCTTPYAVM